MCKVVQGCIASVLVLLKIDSKKDAFLDFSVRLPLKKACKLLLITIATAIWISYLSLIYIVGSRRAMNENWSLLWKIYFGNARSPQPSTDLFKFNKKKSMIEKYFFLSLDVIICVFPFKKIIEVCFETRSAKYPLRYLLHQCQ